MDRETEMIRKQMEETRESLAGKLGALEERVLNTLNDTTGSVVSTVESARDAVRSTVTSVHDALDVKQHVRRHPWGMVVGAIVIGYVGGQLLMPSRQAPRLSDVRRRRHELARLTPADGQGASERSLLERESERFEPAMRKLKDLAICAGAGVVAKMVLPSVSPELRDPVQDVIDEFASALKSTAAPEREPEESPPASMHRQEGAPHHRVRAVKGNGRHS